MTDILSMAPGAELPGCLVLEIHCIVGSATPFWQQGDKESAAPAFEDASNRREVPRLTQTLDTLGVGYVEAPEPHEQRGLDDDQRRFGARRTDHDGRDCDGEKKSPHPGRLA